MVVLTIASTESESDGFNEQFGFTPDKFRGYIEFDIDNYRAYLENVEAIHPRKGELSKLIQKMREDSIEVRIRKTCPAIIRVAEKLNGNLETEYSSTLGKSVPVFVFPPIR